MGVTGVMDPQPASRQAGQGKAGRQAQAHRQAGRQASWPTRPPGDPRPPFPKRPLDRTAPGVCQRRVPAFQARPAARLPPGSAERPATPEETGATVVFSRRPPSVRVCWRGRGSASSVAARRRWPPSPSPSPRSRAIQRRMPRPHAGQSRPRVLPVRPSPLLGLPWACSLGLIELVWVDGGGATNSNNKIRFLVVFTMKKGF